MDGVGQVVGSNLAELQHKSLAALLESVLDPNRAVEDRFLEYVITTEEGQIFNGILAEETSAAITLRGQDGKQQQILRNHVAELRNLGRSFMPEGFERELRPKEMMDLLRYLQEQRTPPKQVPGNSPTLVQAKSSDLIQLLASQCSIYGQTLVYESGYRNLGFWSSGSDKAVWTLETDQAGNYTVELEFACHVNSSGNHLVFEAGDTKLTAAVPSTGSWDHYEHWQLGTLTLPTGLHSISVYPLQAPQNCLIDLRSIKLTRIPD